MAPNESLGDKLKHLADEAADKLADLGDLAEGVAGRVGDAAGDLLEKVGLKDDAERLLDTAQTAAGQLAHQVSDLFDGKPSDAPTAASTVDVTPTAPVGSTSADTSATDI